MGLADRINAFVALGDKINQLSDQEWETLEQGAIRDNGWFIKESVRHSLHAITGWLKEDVLAEWLSYYKIDHIKPNVVGIVMAGNIPLVGFHDLLSVLILGHHAAIKPSSKDKFLIQAICDWISELSSEIAAQISFPDRLTEVDAIIATGSNNSARYFQQYFSNKPNIIRANRTSVAVLSGNESDQEMEKLGEDIYRYFGLGCRNVSKIWIPAHMTIQEVIPHFEIYDDYLQRCHKYQNNYDYNKSIYLINGVQHFDNGFSLFKEDKGLVSPISVLFFEQYQDVDQLKEHLNLHKNNIQCVVSKEQIVPDFVSFGNAQCPSLRDYADGEDTILFLSSLDS